VQANADDEPQDVPDRPTSGFVDWMFTQPEGSVQVAGNGHALHNIPKASRLVSLLKEAHDNGCRWVLVDGPRKFRTSWLIDPWWTTHPQFPQRMIEKTNAGCLDLTQMIDDVQRHVAGDG
jgi:hypothetical protein